MTDRRLYIYTTPPGYGAGAGGRAYNDRLDHPPALRGSGRARIAPG